MNRLQLIVDLDPDVAGGRPAHIVAGDIVRLAFGHDDGQIHGARLIGGRWLPCIGDEGPADPATRRRHVEEAIARAKDPAGHWVDKETRRGAGPGPGPDE